MAKRQSKRAMKPRPWRDGQWTDAHFMAYVRSVLRKASQRWPPISKRRGGRKYVGPNPKQRVEYPCDQCGGYFKRAEIEMHHKIPCGPLTPETAWQFIAKLFCDSEGIAQLCVTCHNAVEAEIRATKNNGGSECQT